MSSVQSILDALEVDVHQDSPEYVLAELSAGTTDTEIRDVIRLYKINLTLKQLTSKLNTQLRATLLKVAKYLKCEEEDAKKPAIVRNIICRIQNLLPESCNICSKTYTVKMDDSPFLDCAACGQEVHRECFAKLLGIQDNAKADINPKNIPGLHYLCKVCEEDRIPKEKVQVKYRPPDSCQTCELSCTHRLRSWDSSLIQIGEETLTSFQTTGEETLTSTQIPPTGTEPPDRLDGNLTEETAAETELVNGQNQPAAAKSSNADIQQREGSDMGDQQGTEPDPPTLVESEVSPVPVPVALNTEIQRVDAPAEKSRKSNKICPFYRNNICRYGDAGKDCPLTHPPKCKKLLLHGADRRKGCIHVTLEKGAPHSTQRCVLPQ